MMHDSLEQLGRDYLAQAEEIDRQVAWLKQQKEAHAGLRKRLRKKIIILDQMAMECRLTGWRLLGYYTDDSILPW